RRSSDLGNHQRARKGQPLYLPFPCRATDRNCLEPIFVPQAVLIVVVGSDVTVADGDEAEEARIVIDQIVRSQRILPAALDALVRGAALCFQHPFIERIGCAEHETVLFSTIVGGVPGTLIKRTQLQVSDTVLGNQPEHVIAIHIVVDSHSGKPASLGETDRGRRATGKPVIYPTLSVYNCRKSHLETTEFRAGIVQSIVGAVLGHHQGTNVTPKIIKQIHAVLYQLGGSIVFTGQQRAETTAETEVGVALGRETRAEAAVIEIYLVLGLIDE